MPGIGATGHRKLANMAAVEAGVDAAWQQSKGVFRKSYFESSIPFKREGDPMASHAPPGSSSPRVIDVVVSSTFRGMDGASFPGG